MKRTTSIFLILLLMICTAIVPADASADDKGTFQKKLTTFSIKNLPIRTNLWGSHKTG